MKEHQDETKQKLEEEIQENINLLKYTEMNKQENRKTLTPDQKKN